MRFLRRSAVVRNILLFCFLSLFFLSIVNSLFSGTSALNLESFLTFLTANKNNVALSLITVFTVVRGLKISSYLFLAFCAYVIIQSITVFIQDFNKIILGLTFLYSVVAYNLFLFLKLELDEPFYNPQYPNNIMPSFENKALPVVIKDGGKNYIGHLTNWGKNGFYCKLINATEIPTGKIEVEVGYEGYLFQAIGTVVTTRRGGIGVKINRNPVPELGWPDFYGIISELGLRPC